MQLVEDGTITANVERFLGYRAGHPLPTTGRARSWDFCFNYFQSNQTPTSDLERSCHQLGYYLASWGMLRARGHLFKHTNVRHYIQAIQVIEAYNSRMSGIDIHLYHLPEVQQLILEAVNELRTALLPRKSAYETLVSKVMMGVWGVIPSYDTWFIVGFKKLAEGCKETRAFNNVGTRSLTQLSEFYDRHSIEIESCAERFETIDFDTAETTGRHLTRAKIVDMFGFQRGYEG